MVFVDFVAYVNLCPISVMKYQEDILLDNTIHKNIRENYHSNVMQKTEKTLGENARSKI